MSQTLSATQMLPTKFEPKVNRRFILEIDCIDSFLVKSVHTPPLKPNMHGELVPKDFHILRVFLHCPIAPSLEQQLLKATKKQRYQGLNPVELKYLDPVGTVVSHWMFKGSKIEEVNFSNPEYGNGELMVCELIVSFDSLDIQY
jgi:hypothetical protein